MASIVRPVTEIIFVTLLSTCTGERGGGGRTAASAGNGVPVSLPSGPPHVLFAPGTPQLLYQSSHIVSDKLGSTLMEPTISSEAAAAAVCAHLSSGDVKIRVTGGNFSRSRCSTMPCPRATPCLQLSVEREALTHKTEKESIV